MELPSAEVEDGDFSRGHAGDVGDRSVGTDQNFAGLLRHVERFHNLESFQIDGDGAVRAWKDSEEKAAVGSGLGGVGVIGNADPVADFVGSGIDDGDARSVLIVGENVSAVGRDGNALHRLGDRDGGDELAIGDVYDADRAGVDVGGVGAADVFTLHEHVRFVLPGA